MKLEGGDVLLYRLNIEIEKNPDINFSVQMASLFQGVLMENVSFEYGQKMHVSSVRPYSQFIQIEENKIIWHISAINDEAYEYLIKPLLKEDFNFIYLRHKDLQLKIISKEVEKKSMDEFLSETFFGKCGRFVKVKFITPCAFKSQGQYIFYPTVRLIMQSLIKKFDSGSNGFSVQADELIEDLENNINIIQYSLKSRLFHLEGIKIPSFVGEVTIRINGPGQMVNLANMLLKYGQYSGIGIKSAMGMGAVLVEDKEVNRNGKR